MSSAAPTSAPASKDAQPPALPGGTLVWGHLHQFFAETIPLLGRLPSTEGDAVRLRFGPVSMWVVSSADGARHVLQTNAKNYRRPSNFAAVLRQTTPRSLFVDEGEPWLQQRRALQPSFHRQRVASFGTLMAEESEKAAVRLLQSSGKTMLVQDEMIRLTLNIVGRALFGVDMEAAGNGRALTHAFDGIFEWMNYGFQRPFAPPAWVPTRANRRFVRARTQSQAIIRSVVEERRRSGGEHHDFLQMLIDLRYDDGTGMSDEHIVWEASSFFLAGHETTALTLTWAWYLLATNPEAEATLHAELDRVLGGRLPTLEDLPKLPYVQHVVDETLRLYPPAWAITRQAIAGDEVAGYPLAAGTRILLNIYGIQRHPHYWSEPDAFRPERFAPNQNAHPRHAYIPFGIGPRLCIGFQFAQYEAQLALATLAQRVRLCVEPGYRADPYPVFALRVRDGLPLRVAQR